MFIIIFNKVVNNTIFPSISIKSFLKWRFSKNVILFVSSWHTYPSLSLIRCNLFFGLLIFGASLISTWSYNPSLTIFLSVYHGSNEIVNLFLIDSLNIACVSAFGINTGLYKHELLIVILILLANVVFITSCRSAVLKDKWKPKFLELFLNVLQKPNMCYSDKWPLILTLLASI